MIMLSKQFYLQVRILKTNDLSTAIWFQSNDNINNNESRKLEKYFELARELKKLLVIIISLFASLSHHYWLVGFHWSPNDCKSPQVSWTLLCILADFYNAIVRMVSILTLIFSSSSLFYQPLGTVQCTPITIGITPIVIGVHWTVPKGW